MELVSGSSACYIDTYLSDFNVQVLDPDTSDTTSLYYFPDVLCCSDVITNLFENEFSISKLLT